MKLYIFTLILFLSYLFPVTSNAFTYYISLAGNDNNSGTSKSKPWETIGKVNGKNFNGDTILFKGGSTFVGALYFTASDKGNPTKPIVIGSYDTGKAIISSGNTFGIYVQNSAGYVIKNLIFSGSGVTSNTSSGILFYTSKDSIVLPFLKIDSVEVYGYHDRGIIFGSSKNLSGYSDVSITNSLIHDNGRAGITSYAVQAYVHKNVYIGYNKVYNNSGLSTDTTGPSGSGIVLANVDGAIIEYCTAYNNGWLHSNPSGGPNGIWTYLCNNVLMQYNESHHNKTGTSKDGGGFDFDGGTTNSTMQYNYSHDNYGGGFLVAEYAGAPLMQNIIVRYNISENDGRKNNYGALYIWSSVSSLGIKSVEFYNNTVYLTPSPNATPVAFLIRSGVFSGVNVRNNIFQITGGVQMISGGSTTGFNFQGNDYYTTGSALKIVWGGTTYSSLSSWQTAKGQEKINGAPSGFQLDPQFSDTTTGMTFSDATQLPNLIRYKLKPTSRILIQGLNLSDIFGTTVGAIDFWGNNIVNKTLFNIGAYQVNTTAAIAPSADAYVRNGTYASKNYGSDTGLAVKSSTSSGFTRYSYLKFALAGVGDVVSAKLRVFGRNTDTTISNIKISSFSILNDSSWNENGITWNTAPAIGTFLSFSGVNNQGRYYEFDVTGFVQEQFAGDKVVTFLIKDTSNQNKNVVFNSKENLQNPPQLVIATTALISKPQANLNNPIRNTTISELEETNALSAKVYPNPCKKDLQLN